MLAVNQALLDYSVLPHLEYYIVLCSPGMPEMLSPGAALVGAGLGRTVALVTDGRFSGASHGNYYQIFLSLVIFVVPQA